MSVDSSQILTPFGFTSLESEIYTFLLKESPSTGYKVARDIGKPTANTYKAIESLQAKGAVVVEQGSNRLCRAVPGDELLARLTRDFEWKRASAEMELSKISTASRDEGLYALKSRSQALEKARQMIAKAEHVVLMVAKGEMVSQLREGIVALATRKVPLYLLSDQSPDVRSVKFANLGGPQLNDLQVVIDAAECMIALFGKGKEDVIQAMWTQSHYIACNQYRAISQMAGTNLHIPALSTLEPYRALLRSGR